MTRGQTTTLTGILLTIASVCGDAFAADDDVIVDGAVPDANVDVIVQQRIVLVQRIRAAEVRLAPFQNDLDARIFPRDGTVQKAARRFAADLELSIHKIDRVCSLTPAQIQRLTLAGRVDQQRFFQRVEEARQRIRHNEFVVADLEMEIQALQAISQTGLLGPTSFFSKAIRANLSPEQLKVSRELHHNALVEKAVDEFQAPVALLKLQRESLTRSMCEEIPAFAVFWSENGSYESAELKEMRNQVLLHEEIIKPILSDSQWNSLKTHIESFDRPSQEQVLNLHIRQVRVFRQAAPMQGK